METFLRLFGSLLALVYHCCDRIVICGYWPLLSRPQHIVYFFRDVQGLSPITKEVLRQRTDDYNRWVAKAAAAIQSPVRRRDRVRHPGIFSCTPRIPADDSAGRRNPRRQRPYRGLRGRTPDGSSRSHRDPG